MKDGELTQRMSIERKCAYVCGEYNGKKEDIPEIRISDYTDGFCVKSYASATALARTWNTGLVERFSAQIGREAANVGVNVLKTPSLGIKNKSEKSSNEKFSEDPYLIGKTAAAFVRGVQSVGIAACVTGFPIDTDGRISLQIDERTLREIYAAPSEIAVREGKAKCVDVNPCIINGIDVRRCARYITGMLRTDWGFDGVAMSTVGNERAANGGLTAGLDYITPNDSKVSSVSIRKAVDRFKTVPSRPFGKEKILTENEVNGETVNPDSLSRAAERIAALAFSVSERRKPPAINDRLDEIGLLANESIVLLKNKNNALPLKDRAKVALVGAQSLTDTFDAHRSGYSDKIIGVTGGFDNKAIAEAKKLTERADAAVVFVGTGLTDGAPLPEGQRRLLGELKAQGVKIIAVLASDSLADSSFDIDCDALLVAGGLGEATPPAVLRIVFGAVNPSGRLAESRSAAALPSSLVGKNSETKYSAGPYLGYRYYDKVGAKIRYPFGFGLSYTTFAYKNLIVGEKGVSFTLTNTGNYDGAETVQLYIGKRDSAIFRPKKELKGFKKVFVKAGETVNVVIPFDNYSFRYFNVATDKWEIEKGDYIVAVGSNAENLPLSGTITLAGTTAHAPYRLAALPSYVSGRVDAVDVKECENLLGYNGGRDLALERQSMKRKKLILSLILVAITAIIDVSLTVSGLVMLTNPVNLAVFLSVNAAAITAFALIVVFAGAVKLTPLVGSRMSFKIKEDHSYMIFPEQASGEDEPLVITNIEQADVSAAPNIVVPQNGRQVTVYNSEVVPFPEICARFVAFAAKNGLRAEPQLYRELFAAMASSRIVVLKSANVDVSIGIAALADAFFGGTGGVVNASPDMTADGLLPDSAALLGSADNISIFTLNNVSPDNCAYMSAILPFAKTPVRPLTVPSKVGKATLSGGVWFFCVPANGANNTAFSKAIAECSTCVEINSRTAVAIPPEPNTEPISFGSFTDAVKRAKAEFYVHEERWKKLDRLEAQLNARAAFCVDNKLFRQLENYTSAAIACGAYENDALDGAIASKIIPVLAAYENQPFRGGENGLSECLDRLFGSDNIIRSHRAAKRLSVD